MKSDMDKLVSEILHDLAQRAPAMPELNALFYALGIDGRSKALQKRAALERYSEDMLLSQDLRQYAQQQLAALPDF